MMITHFIDTQSIGDWEYHKVELDDGRVAILWVGAEDAWDEDLQIICPVGPEVPGDQTGCEVHPDLASADAAWADMVSDL